MVPTITVRRGLLAGYKLIAGYALHCIPYAGALMGRYLKTPPTELGPLWVILLPYGTVFVGAALLFAWSLLWA